MAKHSPVCSPLCIDFIEDLLFSLLLLLFFLLSLACSSVTMRLDMVFFILFAARYTFYYYKLMVFAKL